MLAETQITNLLYRYAECIDTGDLVAAAALFEHARIRIGPEDTIDAARLLGIWKSLIVLHPDGTPRTKHVTTNPIIEIDEDAGTATCRSYYTVLQQTDELSLQTIVTGRYHDRFERVDGRWRFSGLTCQSAARSARRSSARPLRVSRCLRVSQSRSDGTR